MNTNVKIVLCSVLLSFATQNVWAGDELRALSQTRSQSVVCSGPEDLLEVLQQQMGQYIDSVENSPTSEDAQMLINALCLPKEYQDASSKLESALRFANRVGSIPRDRRAQGLQVGDRVRSKLGYISVNIGNSPQASTSSTASNSSFTESLHSRVASSVEESKNTPPSSTRSSRRDVQNLASQPPSYDSPTNSPKSFSGRTTPESSRVVHKSALVTDAISSGSTPLSSFKLQTNDEHKQVDKKISTEHVKSDTSSEEEDSSLGHSSAEMVQQAEEEEEIDYASLLVEEEIVEEEFYTYPDIHEKECRDKGIEHLEDHLADGRCKYVEYCNGALNQLKKLRNLSNKKVVYANNIVGELNDIQIVFNNAKHPKDSDSSKYFKDSQNLLKFLKENTIYINPKLSEILQTSLFIGSIVIEEYQRKQCAFLASVEINGKLKHSANAFIKEYLKLLKDDKDEFQGRLLSLSIQHVNFINDATWPELSEIFNMGLVRLEVINCKLSRFTYDIHSISDTTLSLSEIIIKNNTLEDKIYFDKFFKNHLDRFSHLYWIDLSSNKLHGIFDSRSKFLHELLYANFSNNELTRDNKGEYFKNIGNAGDADCSLQAMESSKYLKYLDFTHNPIATDKFLHGGALINLEYLGLRGAHITEFLCDPLHAKALVIDISENSLESASNARVIKDSISKCFPSLKGMICVDMINKLSRTPNTVPCELKFHLHKCEKLEFAIFKLQQVFMVKEGVKVYIMDANGKITELRVNTDIKKLALTFKRPTMKYENTLLQYLSEKPKISKKK